MSEFASFFFAIAMGMVAAALHLLATWHAARHLRLEGPPRSGAGLAGRSLLVAGSILAIVPIAGQALWAFPLGFVSLRWFVLRRMCF